MVREIERQINRVTTSIARMPLPTLLEHLQRTDEFARELLHLDGIQLSTWAKHTFCERVQNAIDKTILARLAADERKLLKQLARATARGHRPAKEALRRVCSSRSMKLLALYHANRSLKHNKRTSMRALAAEVADLDLFAVETEKTEIFALPKADGIRVIRSYGLYHRARQILVRRAMQAMSTLRSEQFAVSKKGRNALIDQVAEHLQEGHKWVVEVDIANCFPTFAATETSLVAAIQELAPFHKEVVRHSITALGTSHTHSRANLPSISRTMNSRKELPQGSLCSNAFVEARVAKVLDFMSQDAAVSGIAIVTYVDNFTLLAPTKRLLERAMLSLKRALAHCSSGSWRLKEEVQIRRVDQGFRLLGYTMTRKQGETHVRISDDGWARFKHQCHTLLTKGEGSTSERVKASAAI